MKKKGQKKFRDMKLASKMIAIYFIFIGICGLIAISALQISLNIYDEKLYDKSLQELDFFTQRVNEDLKEVEDLSYSITLSTEVQQQLSKITTLNYLSGEYSYEMYLFRNILLNELNIHEIVRSVTYTDSEQTKFTVGTATADASENFVLMLGKAHNAKGAYVTQNPTENFPYMLSGRDILKHLDSSLDYLGTLIFTCDIAGMIEGQINRLEAKSAALYVYSQDGMIYKSDDVGFSQLPTMESAQGYEIVEHSGQRYFMCYLKSSKNEWMYVNIFPYSEIFGQTMQVRYMLIVGLLVLFLGTAVVMQKVSRVVTKPLEQLSESMQIVETGDFQGAKIVLGEDVRRDEVGILAQDFQIMLDKIYVLIHENYEKQLLLKDTEYRMMQAQMNPHFLYNTLNAINWMVRASRNEEAVKMIVELGELLRASFSKKPYTTVESDVLLAKNYITIQQFRYQKRVEFIIDKRGELDNYMIPHMTIQPLVENCIQYGVENSLHGCQVIIKVQEEDETIRIEVADNGPGMTAEELDQVKNFTAEPKGHGIGLKNIKERLEMTYQNSEFVIESQAGKGTMVRICIPKIREEELHV